MQFLSIDECRCGRRSTLFSGGGSREVQVPSPQAPRPMTVARAVELLVAELVADNVPQPLSMRFTLAAIASDLCRLAGEPAPDAVAAALDEAVHAPVRRAETHREPAFDAD